MPISPWVGTSPEVKEESCFRSNYEKFSALKLWRQEKKMNVVSVIPHFGDNDRMLIQLFVYLLQPEDHHDHHLLYNCASHGRQAIQRMEVLKRGKAGPNSISNLQ